MSEILFNGKFFSDNISHTTTGNNGNVARATHWFDRPYKIKIGTVAGGSDQIMFIFSDNEGRESFVLDNTSLAGASYEFALATDHINLAITTKIGEDPAGPYDANIFYTITGD